MKRTALAGAAIAALALSACGGGGDHSREDARDAPKSDVDYAIPHVTAFNNHYPTIESKCIGETGLLAVVGTHDTTGGALIVQPNPTCPGYRPGMVAPAASTVAGGSGSNK